MNPVAMLKANHRATLFLIAAYMALIFFGSSVPGKDVPPEVGPRSSLLHVLEYSVLGFLLLPATGRLRYPVLIAIAIGGVYGITDELHQYFVPGRTCSLADVSCDCLGAAAGALLPKMLGER